MEKKEKENQQGAARAPWYGPGLRKADYPFFFQITPPISSLLTPPRLITMLSWDTDHGAVDGACPSSTRTQPPPRTHPHADEATA